MVCILFMESTLAFGDWGCQPTKSASVIAGAASLVEGWGELGGDFLIFGVVGTDFHGHWFGVAAGFALMAVLIQLSF